MSSATPSSTRTQATVKSRPRKLTPRQKRAVEHRSGPARVIGLSGSGKTTVIVRRAVRLARSGKRLSTALLVMSYSEQSVRDLQQRLVQSLGLMRQVQVSTFHAWGFSLLKQYHREAGFTQSPTLLGDKHATVERLIRAMPKQARQALPKIWRVLHLIELAANTDRPIGELATRCFKEAHRVAATKDLAERYARHKKQHGLVDYEDMLVLARNLLRDHPAICRQVACSYRYVMIDEFQDANPVQVELIQLLGAKNPNVMVVGDDYQTIYGFRGAQFGKLRDFPKLFPGCSRYTLRKTQRCSQEIAALANAVVDRMPNVPKKHLLSAKSGPQPRYIRVADRDEQDEVVCKIITALRQRGLRPQQIAILARQQAGLNHIYDALLDQGIPAERRYLQAPDQAHIADFMSLLRLAVDLTDRPALERVLGLLIGDDTKRLQAIVAKVLRSGCRGLTGHTGAPYARDLKRLREALRKLDRHTPAEKVVCIMLDLDRPWMRRHYPDSRLRRHDFGQMRRWARRFPRTQALLAALPGLLSAGAQEERVVLSTIHGAKGLEWHAVVLIDLVDGLLPIHHALADPGQVEEERRLFYEALTRSRQYLYLVQSAVDIQGTAYRQPSRFVTEIAAFGRLTRRVHIRG